MDRSTCIYIEMANYRNRFAVNAKITSDRALRPIKP